MQRLTKITVLAVAALTLMAIMSVASASAGTALCSKAYSYCNPEDVKPSGTQFVAEASGNNSAFYIDTANKFRCSFNRMAVESTMKVGQPLTAKFTGTLEPSKCGFTEEYPSCSTASLNSPPTTIEKTEKGAGVIKVGTKASPLTLTLKCQFEYYPILPYNINCQYTATDAVQMNFDGNKLVTVSAPLTRVSGASQCESATLHVSDDKTASSPYISEELETVFCKTQGSFCSNANTKPVGSILSAVGGDTGGITVTNNIGEQVLNCTGGHFNFTSMGSSAFPPDVPMYMAAATDVSVNPTKCSEWYQPAGKACSSVELSDPNSLVRLLWENTGVAYIGSESEPLTISMSCEGSITCNFAAAYETEMNINTVTGAATAKNVPLNLVSGSTVFCGSKATLAVNDIVDQLTSEGETYISRI